VPGGQEMSEITGLLGQVVAVEHLDDAVATTRNWGLLSAPASCAPISASTPQASGSRTGATSSWSVRRIPRPRWAGPSLPSWSSAATAYISHPWPWMTSTGSMTSSSSVDFRFSASSTGASRAGHRV